MCSSAVKVIMYSKSWCEMFNKKEIFLQLVGSEPMGRTIDKESNNGGSLNLFIFIYDPPRITIFLYSILQQDIKSKQKIFNK